MLDELVRPSDRTGYDEPEPHGHSIVPWDRLTENDRLHFADEFGELESAPELQILRLFVSHVGTVGGRAFGSPSLFVGNGIWLHADRPAPEPLSRIVQQLREWIDLPAGDLARLCGVGRRQFYNLFGGSTRTSANREAHIRLVHEIVEGLRSASGQDRGRLRSALLMPLQPDYRSFLETASSQDPEATRAMGRELIDRLSAGDVEGMFPRPAPSFRSSSPDAEAQALEAIREASSVAGDDGR